ncbi:hypothetical protein ACYFX5_17015 [Bremerella sp. T1]|uniref:hypothetical protein n=1 Tax=Bremerella sp. TYQ1 TaxID=3119568 RepID=UPI001CCE34D7|nr:hypothetical protein [Bremerella volcania]UBM34760.1 hypothetical protein LA756_18965 [Bremerella volcania]
MILLALLDALPIPSPLLVGLVIGLIVVGVVVYLYVLPKKDEPPEVAPVEIAIDPMLPSGPKSLMGPEVRVYNVPVRIVAIVVAPAGRGHDVLSEETLRGLMESFLPQMMAVVRAHRPDVYRWPGQMSTRGFSQRFFTQANLPGQHGEGTPWTAVAGRFDYQANGYLIGLVCCADEDNPLGQVLVEQKQQWTDIVRIS